mgnify:CR=1 FL=1
MAYKKVIGNYQSNADFSPGLVGYQITEGSITMFNSFYTTANLEGRSGQFFETEGFSQAVSLSSLEINSFENEQFIKNNLNLVLNLDNKDLFNYTLFGSLREHIKASVTNIIKKWPGSLYINKRVSGATLNTVLDYTYNTFTDRATFKIPTSTIRNHFNISLLNTPDQFQAYTGIKRMGVDYYKYVIKYPVTGSTIGNSPGYANNVVEYPIVAFTGLTNLSKNYVYFKVKGNPFTGATGFGFGGILSDNFHIKPKSQIVEEFFSNLKGLDSFLLNRNTTPIYTSEFIVPKENVNGRGFIEVPQKYTWPTTDGYNIDISTTSYQSYLVSLLTLATSYDTYKTDLVSRFFTTESIKEFDTSDKRIQKLLRIYGREFDEVKRYIDGLAFANRVSYNKSKNIPDQLIKNFARTLGFQTINFNEESKLLESLFGGTSNPIFSGTSVGLTPVEFDIELWRRLIVNAGYLFRSKGTRKIIEFFLKFIGAPESLIDFNEYVYTTKSKLNTELVNESINYLTQTVGNSPTELDVPMDGEGYPRIIPNTDDYYFQMRGGWYKQSREMGANSPHLGFYDGGQEYFNRFRCFTDVTGGTFTTASYPSGTIPQSDLRVILVSNEEGLENNFDFIKSPLGTGTGLGYTDSDGSGGVGKGNTPQPCDPNNPGLYCTWSNVADAAQYGGGAAVFVFEHIGADIPANMQQLAKDLYDSGFAVLTISDYAQPSLYPISSVSDHNVGEEWGFLQNPAVDPMNPLTQGWDLYPSSSDGPGYNITGTVPEANILAHNSPPNENIMNTLYMLNINQGRWVHVQNPNLYQAGLQSEALFSNIMDFLTMRSEMYRQYFSFHWENSFTQEIYVSCPGFTLTPQIDNKKSWAIIEDVTINNSRSWSISDGNTATTNTIRDTEYFVGDSDKLVLNTKMLDAHLNIAKGIEYDVYKYNKDYGFPIAENFEYFSQNYSPTMGDPATPGTDRYMENLLYPAPSNKTNPFMASSTDPLNPFNFYYGSQLSAASFTVSATTFAQYIDRLSTNFINVKNRKTIGGGGFGFQPNWPAYPTLRNLYESYVSGGTYSTSTGVITYPFSSNELNYDNMIGFMTKIEPYWAPLIEQFIPSTTIIGLGTKYSNTVFDRQKYVYKHGQHSSMEIESLDNTTMLNGMSDVWGASDAVGGYPDEKYPHSPWFNKTVLYSKGIGPGNTATQTEPLILVRDNGTNTAAGVSTPLNCIYSGGKYYFKIGVRFISGKQNIAGVFGGQNTYNVGGSIGCANNAVVLGPPTGCYDYIPIVGVPERQGKIWLKDVGATTGGDVVINVFGPGIYDVTWNPAAGTSNNLKIVTDINGLIIDNIQLYRIDGENYFVTNNLRNGGFTWPMEYFDANQDNDLNRVMHWRGESGSAQPAAGTTKWGIMPGHNNIWPGTDGTESVTTIDWYERGLIDDTD